MLGQGVPEGRAAGAWTKLLSGPGIQGAGGEDVGAAGLGSSLEKLPRRPLVRRVCRPTGLGGHAGVLLPSWERVWGLAGAGGEEDWPPVCSCSDCHRWEPRVHPQGQEGRQSRGHKAAGRAPLLSTKQEARPPARGTVVETAWRAEAEAIGA